MDSREQVLKRGFSTFPRFCGLVDIIPKDLNERDSAEQTGHRAKLVLNAIQRIFCIERTGRDIVLKPRQVGFSTEEQARDIYFALKRPGAQVVTVCQSQSDNSPLKNLSRGYRVMFEGLKATGVDIKFRTFSETHWEIADTGSTIKLMVAGSSEAAASKKGRAGTIHRLHLTETAFYEHADTTLNALLECVPSRSTGSEIVNESTPNGAAGYFYEQCKAAEQGRSAYKFHFYPWYAHGEYRTPLPPGESLPPAVGEEQAELEAKLRNLGVTDEQLLWYRHKAIEKGQNVEQEYPNDPETCFLVSGRPFFDQRVTAQLVRGVIDPIESRKGGRIRIYAKPVPGRDYVGALDCSEGIGGDPSGAVFYDRESGEHVASIDGQFQPHDAGDVSVALCREYNDALLVVERNNHGHAVLMAVKNLGYRRVYKHLDDKRGWPTTAITRPIMLDGLEEAHRKGHFKTHDKALLTQMRKFMINNNGKPEAATGAHDDLVISAAIGWAVRQRKSIRGSVGSDLAAVL